MTGRARDASVTLDAADFRILNALQREPDLSIAELSDKVGLSHTPCWRRLKRLQADSESL